LVGEAGTGKTWLAQAIHESSATRERAFAALDCERLPATAIAETLFGGGRMLHRPGFGALYLKEPSHLPHDLQLRLLDWVGHAARRARDLGRRLIAGWIRAPLGEVHAGRLLEKLYAVLSTLLIELPPLRERLGDLAKLVDRMLEQLNRFGERRIAGLTVPAWAIACEYRWPGNLRELRLMLMNCHARVSSERIDAADLPASMRQPAALQQSPTTAMDHPMPLDSILEKVERRLIELALRRARGNKSRAADLLAVWRPRLLRRMEALGLNQGSGIRN